MCLRSSVFFSALAINLSYCSWHAPFLCAMRVHLKDISISTRFYVDICFYNDFYRSLTGIEDVLYWEFHSQL